MLSQVLIQIGSGASPQVSVVDNPQRRRPHEFEDAAHGLVAPHLGSSDLIILAEYAQGLGFRVNRFDVFSALLEPLQEDEADEVSEALVAALEAGGAEQCIIEMRSTFAELTVVGVDFSGPDYRPLSIRRDGVAVIQNSASLLDLLRGALGSVRLT